MTHRPLSGYLLASLTGLFIVIFSTESPAQELSSALKADLLKVFAASTKEMIVNGVKIRGHEIGGGKFKPCEGDPIDIKDRPLRKSDRCRLPGGTHTVRSVGGEIVELDAKASTVTIKNDSGTLAKFFVPSSVRMVTDGKLEQSQTMRFDKMEDNKRRRIILYFVIPERVEAVAVGY